MSSVIVPIVTIDEVLSHPNADRLSVVKIAGWQVVVGKDSVKAGDTVAYIPPDALVTDAWASHWGVTNYLSNGRVRSVKLRGEPSFGFTARVGIRETEALYAAGLIDDAGAIIDRENVAHAFGITKYAPPIKGFSGNQRQEDPRLSRFTSIENLRHFPGGFTDGQDVWISEKVHGCVAFSTLISMADGSKKKVNSIKVGDEVLGMRDGAVVATTVLNTFNNGPAKDWLNIKGQRRQVGRGSSFFSANVTPNHRFWSPEKEDYVAAEDLRVGDTLSILRSERRLTPIQEQVILGKLLGDGYLSVGNSTAYISFGHKSEHEAYVDWTIRGLGDLGDRAKYASTSGYGTDMVRSSSNSSGYVLDTFGDFVGESGVKVVPPWVADRLGPIAMAFWYMDDGSLCHNPDQEDRVNFATNGFSKADCDVLALALKKFDIDATIFESIGYRIRLGSDDSEKFFLLIAPYVPTVMQYKLPERYRGHDGWLPSMEMPYKPDLVSVTIDSIEPYLPARLTKFDIETGTHNFFANGILVHNSQSRVSLIDGEWMAASKRVQRDPERDESDAIIFDTSKSSTYWYPLTLDPVRDLLTYFATQHKQVILFGEIYGPSIQKFDYGIPKGQLGYVAFDLMLDGKYVDGPEFSDICQFFRVPQVPVLYSGPYDAEGVKALTLGRSLLGGEHIREGIVIRPFEEEHDPKFGRRVLKLVSDDYLTGGVEDLQEEAA